MSDLRLASFKKLSLQGHGRVLMTVAAAPHRKIASPFSSGFACRMEQERPELMDTRKLKGPFESSTRGPVAHAAGFG